MINAQFLFSNVSDRESDINILRNFMTGGKTITKYDPNKVYNTDDLVYTLNNLTGEMVLYTAKEDGLTGSLNTSKWIKYNLGGMVDELYHQFVINSTYEPDNDYNRIWLMPVDQRVQKLPETIPLYSDSKVSMIFEEHGEVPIVEEVSANITNSLGNGDIVLDTEGEYSMEVDQELIDSFRESGIIYIDEQEDIEVSTTTPATNNPANTWFDTNISDD